VARTHRDSGSDYWKNASVLSDAVDRWWRAQLQAAFALIATLVFAAPAAAIPPPPPAQQAVAIVKAGVVWYDNGVVSLIGPAGTRTVLARWKQSYPFGAPQISSSGVAVALAAENRFLGGIPPAPLATVAFGQKGGAHECPRWQPELHSVGNFVVAGDQLVAAAETTCGRRATSPQPVFVKNLRGGPWRVLRWLHGTAPPMLAADGSLVAIGAQRSPSSTAVRVVNVESGSTVAHANLPDGYLTFAAPDRLTDSIPTFGSFPFYFRLETVDGSFSGARGSLGGGYRTALYTTAGRLVGTLGTEGTLTQTSASRQVEVDYNPSAETQTVVMKRIPGGETRDVIGMNPPARGLRGLAWRWPKLALIETTSTALPDGQFNCRYGTYGPPSAPFLETFNLAKHGTFVPPPPTPPQPTPQQFFAACGPPAP
jgi:hypothetical protein